MQKSGVGNCCIPDKGKRYETSRLLTFNAWEGCHTFTVPEGTPVKFAEGGMGFHPYVDPQHATLTDETCAELAKRPRSLWKHDTTHHYIFVPLDGVRECEAEKESA